MLNIFVKSISIAIATKGGGVRLPFPPPQKGSGQTFAEKQITDKSGKVEKGNYRSDFICHEYDSNRSGYLWVLSSTTDTTFHTERTSLSEC